MSNNTNTNVQIVTAAVVRTWAAERGLPVGARGAIPAEVQNAFNARHKAKTYAGTDPAGTIKVKVPTTNARGAKITKTVHVPASDLRKALGAEGKRGRVNMDAAAQYVIGAGLV
jgi:hypothetical protein